MNPTPARVHAHVAVSNGARGFQSFYQSESLECLYSERLDEVIADFLVVIGTRLPVDQRDVEALARVQRGRGAASNARANDHDVVLLCAGAHGDLWRRSKCWRSFISRGAHSSLMKPRPTGPSRPGSI